MSEQELEFKVKVTVTAPTEMSSREVLSEIEWSLKHLVPPVKLAQLQELEWVRTKSGKSLL